MALLVPALRVNAGNDAPLRPEGAFVLYWMVAARRPFHNFALDRAVVLAEELQRPLVVFEPLRTAYPWASERIHAFVMQGMASNARYFADKAVTYFPYVEPAPGQGGGLLEALSAHACCVVTDEFPCFFLPRMLRAAGEKLSVRLEVVDHTGLLPLRLAAGRSYPTAYSFRRFMQAEVAGALSQLASEEPLRGRRLTRLSALPAGVLARWPMVSTADLAAPAALVAKLPIDHGVGISPVLRGGHDAAEAQLQSFIAGALSRYGEERSHPDAQAASGLSPYLHFGHIATQRVFKAVAESAGWDGMPHAEKPTGKRAGFWGMEANAESFLDELITWRELCFNTAFTLPDYAKFGSLPEWARKTLAKHAVDPRPQRYSLDALESAATHDRVWNAAQRELLQEGRMQNYVRMLWGKKILEWSAAPEEALERALHLNNKYAIDGRDPNSYGGVFWTFGRYDRPWAPERPIFGTIRYMSSDNTVRKLHLNKYLERYGQGQLSLGLRG
jgi:deoxyribodipyrimidine photo-lyase